MKVDEINKDLSIITNKLDKLSLYSNDIEHQIIVSDLKKSIRSILKKAVEYGNDKGLEGSKFKKRLAE